ncbi:MAG: potassium transporter KefB [Rhodospirillales bacterium]|nr:potassium transporter KefB [Rhodospirillales bacterium]
MPEHHHYLHEVLILLVALLAVVPLFVRLRLGTVLAYLTIGVAAGPLGFGLITADRTIETLGELGVVFLLFTIGLEINVERLRLFGLRTYGMALLQLPVTALPLAWAAHMAGVSVGGSLLIGGALAVSSTAIVIQLLSERGHMTGQVGRAAIAILLMQDLAVAPMIVLVTAYGSAEQSMGAALGLASIKFMIFIVVIAVFQRLALRPLLRLAASAREPEVFTAAGLLLVLGIGTLSQEVGLSMALGAFVAGLMVADTEFRHQVSADIEPVRGLFLGLFFVSVGMGLDLRFAAANIGIIAAAVAVLMVVKAVSMFLVARAFRLATPRAISLATLLAQGSEFAFVLIPLGAAGGLLDREATQVSTVAVGLSMALMPIGAIAFDWIAKRFVATHSTRGDLQVEGGELHDHVVIAGFGQVGMAVARFLVAESVPFLVLDLSENRVSACRSKGLPVFYGNAARKEVLRAARLDRAQVLAVAVPDPAVAEQITAIARQSFRHLRIFVARPIEDWVPKLRAAGADAIVLDSLTTALELAERVMMVHAPEADESM